MGQIFIENALLGKEITIAGDGSDRLDFTYIKDLEAGIELVVSKDAAINETFNLTFERFQNARGHGEDHAREFSRPRIEL